MKVINIEDIDLNNSYFHFTERINLPSIESEGLKAQVGDASGLVQDEPRVCLSQGGKGILGIKNSFIFEFKKLRICDIPEGYREYFDISDFSSKEQVQENAVYDALEKRFKNEIYFVVDAEEGVDFSREDIHGMGSNFDIKGKINHDIEPAKLSILTTPNGNSAFDVIEYVYNRLLAKNPGKEYLIKSMNSDLAQMMDYLQTKDKKGFSMELLITDAIKNVTTDDVKKCEFDMQKLIIHDTPHLNQSNSHEQKNEQNISR